MLLGDNGTLVYNKVLYSRMQYDTDRDLQPLALVAKVPMFLVVNKDFPASTLSEFIAEARKRPIPCWSVRQRSPRKPHPWSGLRRPSGCHSGSGG